MGDILSHTGFFLFRYTPSGFSEYQWLRAVHIYKVDPRTPIFIASSSYLLLPLGVDLIRLIVYSSYLTRIYG
jgi:hypothetical protein